MGVVKKMQLEQAEREYSAHLRKIQQELNDLPYPYGDWDDPETYEAFRLACDKDD